MRDMSKKEKMELDELYQLAKEKNIKVMDFPLPENTAVTLNMGEDSFVGVDPAVFGSKCREKVVLAHELGHIETDSVYSFKSEKNLRNSKEQKAEKWAIERLIPKEELFSQIKKIGYTDVPTLAVHFEVTEEFMDKAIKYYSKQNN